MRIDKSKDVMRSVDKDLDVRYRWLGIKAMKNQYQPRTYHSKDKNGKHINMYRRAQEAATYWAEEIWKKE